MKIRVRGQIGDANPDTIRVLIWQDLAEMEGLPCTEATRRLVAERLGRTLGELPICVTVEMTGEYLEGGVWRFSGAAT